MMPPNPPHRQRADGPGAAHSPTTDDTLHSDVDADARDSDAVPRSTSLAPEALLASSDHEIKNVPAEITGTGRAASATVQSSDTLPPQSVLEHSRNNDGARGGAHPDGSPRRGGASSRLTFSSMSDELDASGDAPPASCPSTQTPPPRKTVRIIEEDDVDDAQPASFDGDQNSSSRLSDTRGPMNASATLPMRSGERSNDFMDNDGSRAISRSAHHQSDDTSFRSPPSPSVAKSPSGREGSALPVPEACSPGGTRRTVMFDNVVVDSGSQSPGLVPSNPPSPHGGSPMGSPSVKSCIKRATVTSDTARSPPDDGVLRVSMSSGQFQPTSPERSPQHVRFTQSTDTVPEVTLTHDDLDVDTSAHADEKRLSQDEVKKRSPTRVVRQSSSDHFTSAVQMSPLMHANGNTTAATAPVVVGKASKDGRGKEPDLALLSLSSSPGSPPNGLAKKSSSALVNSNGRRPTGKRSLSITSDGDTPNHQTPVASRASSYRQRQSATTTKKSKSDATTDWELRPNRLPSIDATVERTPEHEDCSFIFKPPPFGGGLLGRFIADGASLYEQWTSVAALYFLLLYVLAAILHALAWQVTIVSIIFICLLVFAVLIAGLWLRFSRDCSRLPIVGLVVGSGAVFASMFGDSCAPFSIGGGSFLLHSLATVATMPIFGAKLRLTVAACLVHFVATPIVFAAIDGTAGRMNDGLGCFVKTNDVPVASTAASPTANTAAALARDVTAQRAMNTQAASSSSSGVGATAGEVQMQSVATALTPMIGDATVRALLRFLPLLLVPLCLFVIAGRVAVALLRQRSKCDELACAVEFALEQEAMATMADVAEEHAQRNTGMSLLEEAMCDLAVEAHSLSIAFTALHNMNGGQAAVSTTCPVSTATTPVAGQPHFLSTGAFTQSGSGTAVRSLSTSLSVSSRAGHRASVAHVLRSAAAAAACAAVAGNGGSQRVVDDNGRPVNVTLSREGSAAQMLDNPDHSVRLSVTGPSAAYSPPEAGTFDPNGAGSAPVPETRAVGRRQDSRAFGNQSQTSITSDDPQRKFGATLLFDAAAPTRNPSRVSTTAPGIRGSPDDAAGGEWTGARPEADGGAGGTTIASWSMMQEDFATTAHGNGNGNGGTFDRPASSKSREKYLRPQQGDGTLTRYADTSDTESDNGRPTSAPRISASPNASLSLGRGGRLTGMVGSFSADPDATTDLLAVRSPVNRKRSEGLALAMNGFTKSAARRQSVAVSRLMRRNSSNGHVAGYPSVHASGGGIVSPAQTPTSHGLVSHLTPTAVVATTVAPVSHRSAFVACFSLPNMHTYCKQQPAVPETVQLIVSAFAETVSTALQECNGEFLFTEMDDIFCAFDDCPSACAAGLRVKDEFASDTHHLSNVFKNSITRPMAPFVQIMHSAVMAAELGAAHGRGSLMGWCECRSVMHTVKMHIARSHIDPPAVLLARSLKTLAEADFNVASSEFTSLLLVESSKSTTHQGYPVLQSSVPKLHVLDERKFYTMPDADELLRDAVGHAADVRTIGDSDDDSDDDDGFFAQSGRINRSTTFAMLAQPPLVTLQLLGDSDGSDDGDPTEGMTPAQLKRRRLKRKKLMKKYKELDPLVLELWHKFDADGNGRLDMEEIYDMLMELDVTLDEESFEKFFMELDEDGNGYVTLDEFANVFTSHQGMVSGRIAAEIKKVASSGIDNDSMPMLRAVWRKYDADLQGSLPPADVQKILAEFGIHRTLQEVELLVEKVDNNGNHMMEFDELADLFDGGGEGTFSSARNNARKERMQFVNRLMDDIESGTLFSTTEQVDRDRVVSITEFLRLYMSPVMILYIVYNASLTSYRVAMGSEEHTSRIHIIIDMTLDIVYYLWFVAKVFLTARENRGEILHTRKDVWRTYLPSVEFVIDLLAVIPLDVAFLACGGLDRDAKCGEYGYYRVNKILLVYHFTALFANVAQLLRPTFASVMEAMVWFVAGAHFFACCVLGLTRNIGQDKMKTMLFADQILDDRSTMYLQSFLWAMQSLAGQVRGPVLQEDDKQVGLMLLAVAVGLPLLAAMLATIGNILHIKTAEALFLQRVDEVRSYFSYVAQANPLVDLNAEQEVIKYYRHMYFTTGSLEMAVNPLKDVPIELSIRMTIVTGLDMLRKVPIFQEACENLEFVHEMASKMEERVLEPCETVMTKGERGTDMYFITHGDCHVVTPQGIRVFTLRKGNFFGEIALLHKVKRTATIENGDRYTNVLRLDKRDFDEVMETFPQCLTYVSKAAQGRLDEILAKEAEEAKAEREKKATRFAMSVSRSMSTSVRVPGEMGTSATSTSSHHSVGTKNNLTAAGGGAHTPIRSPPDTLPLVPEDSCEE